MWHNRWTSNSEQSKPGWWPSITQRSGSAEWRPCSRSQRQRPRIVSQTWCAISSLSFVINFGRFQNLNSRLWREQFLRRLTGLRELSTSQSSRWDSATSSVADAVLYATCCDRTPWKTSTPGVTTQTSWWTWSWRPPTSSTRRRWWVGLKSFGN